MRLVVRWEIKQRLIQLQVSAKSMIGKELAWELLGALCREYKLSSEQPLAAMRDRASVNRVAIQHVKITFPNLLDISCFAHTLNLVETKFEPPLVKEFDKSWISCSPKVLRPSLNGRVRQVGQRHPSLKLVGGEGGRCSTRLCNSLVMFFHFYKNRLNLHQLQGKATSDSCRPCQEFTTAN